MKKLTAEELEEQRKRLRSIDWDALIEKSKDSPPPKEYTREELKQNHLEDLCEWHGYLEDSEAEVRALKKELAEKERLIRELTEKINSIYQLSKEVVTEQQKETVAASA